MKRFLISIFISAIFINIFIISGCKKSSHSAPSPAPTMPVTFVTQWGSPGSDESCFNTPVGVAVDVTGNVYVADEFNNRIQKFSGTGAFLAQWGGSYTTPGSGNGGLNSPVGVAVDVTGNVYVADGNDLIQVFSSGGTFITQWGGQGYGNGNGTFNLPYAAAIGNSGTVYVVDNSDYIIQEFNSAYTYVTQWPSPAAAGTGIGQFDDPVGVATDSTGNVYVTDFYNNNVQVFSSSGAYMTQWGSSFANPGYGIGQLNGPFGIAIDSGGNVYVVDQGNYRVEEFSSTGKCLKQWGGYGYGEYQFIMPSGVAVDSSGNIFVVDTGTNKVKKFAPLP